MLEISSLQGLMAVLWALLSNKDGGLGAAAPRSMARTPAPVSPGRGFRGGPRQLRHLPRPGPLAFCWPWPPGPPAPFEGLYFFG